ncbi:MAG TPA: hypothetical protein VFJ11_00525 [Gaiellaceae bacterium]|nr:hypothetical protein [Gaiellaceae bacterium]
MKRTLKADIGENADWRAPTCAIWAVFARLLVEWPFGAADVAAIATATVDRQRKRWRHSLTLA